MNSSAPDPNPCLSMSCNSNGSCIEDVNESGAKKKYAATPPECVLKITVDVYIESECPFSVDFIQDQIRPTYDKIKNVVFLTFIPFGNAWSALERQELFGDFFRVPAW
jgi:hypothetical protein